MDLEFLTKKKNQNHKKRTTENKNHTNQLAGHLSGYLLSSQEHLTFCSTPKTGLTALPLPLSQ